MKLRTIIMSTLAVLAIGTGGWYYASPGLTLKAMRDAAQAKDSDALAQYVDFPALKEDLKAELVSAMAAKAAQENGGLGQLGSAIGMMFADKLIDGMVSPAGIRVLFATQSKQEIGGALAGSPKGLASAFNAGSDDVDIKREGLSAFSVRSKKEPGKGALQFKRNGFGWKLVGIDLPEGGLK